MKLISITEENILPALEEATDQELDQLDFGVVKMDKEGKVISYNSRQASQAGKKQEEVAGKNFFADLAPCTNNQIVAGKFGSKENALDEYVEYIFTYKSSPTRVSLRLLSDPEKTTQYLLIKNH